MVVAAVGVVCPVRGRLPHWRSCLVAGVHSCQRRQEHLLPSCPTKLACTTAPFHTCLEERAAMLADANEIRAAEAEGVQIMASQGPRSEL